MAGPKVSRDMAGSFEMRRPALSDLGEVAPAGEGRREGSVACG
jgi:hypothetical protein